MAACQKDCLARQLCEPGVYENWLKCSWNFKLVLSVYTLGRVHVNYIQTNMQVIRVCRLLPFLWKHCKLYVRMKEQNQFCGSVEEMTELLLLKLSSADN